MKGTIITAILFTIASTLAAQSTYKHAVGGGFANYITLGTNDEGVLPGYGFSAGIDHVYRPHKRFALNSRVEYVSFQRRLDYALVFGNQFNGNGFNPSIPPGEDINSITIFTRVGALSATLLPNIYIINKNKISLYVLAGISVQMQLHAVQKMNVSNAEPSRVSLSDVANSAGDLIDIGLVAGVGLEYAVKGNHIIRIEPTFRMADLAQFGQDAPNLKSLILYEGNNRINSLYAGVNFSYVFAVGN